MELFDINLKNKGHYGCLSEEVDDDKGLAEGTSSYPPYQSEFGFPYRTNCAQTVSLQSNVTFDLHEKSEHLKEKQDTLIDTMKIDNQKGMSLSLLFVFYVPSTVRSFRDGTPFTVLCEGREARFLHSSDRESNSGLPHASPVIM